jgi:hypothetical protein
MKKNSLLRLRKHTPRSWIASQVEGLLDEFFLMLDAVRIKLREMIYICA